MFVPVSLRLYFVCRHDRSTPRNCTCRTELWYSFSRFTASVASVSLNICRRCCLFFRTKIQKKPCFRPVLFSETADLARCVISSTRCHVFWISSPCVSLKDSLLFYTNDSEREHATRQPAYITVITVNIIMIEVCLWKMFVCFVFLIRSPT